MTAKSAIGPKGLKTVWCKTSIREISSDFATLEASIRI